MARFVLSPAFARWLPAEARGLREFDVDGARLDLALIALFERLPGLRGYVLDEHGVVRHHVAVFIDGQSIHDKADLAVPLATFSEVHLMQALSGG
jgi:molybdopterin synthase sulfur carrier subunit